MEDKLIDFSAGDPHNAASLATPRDDLTGIQVKLHELENGVAMHILGTTSQQTLS